MERSKVYELIDGEREYQDAQWTKAGMTGTPNPLTVGEFILLMEDYLAQARKVWIQEAKPNTMSTVLVRKVAGIAVNCMEQHGAPSRK